MQIELQDSRGELFSCTFFLQALPAPACRCLLPVPYMCTATTPAGCLLKVHRADPAVAPAILPCRRRAPLAPQPVEHRRLPPGGLPRLPAGLGGEPWLRAAASCRYFSLADASVAVLACSASLLQGLLHVPLYLLHAQSFACEVCGLHWAGPGWGWVRLPSPLQSHCRWLPSPRSPSTKCPALLVRLKRDGKLLLASSTVCACRPGHTGVEP